MLLIPAALVIQKTLSFCRAVKLANLINPHIFFGKKCVLFLLCTSYCITMLVQPVYKETAFQDLTGKRSHHPMSQLLVNTF